MISTKDIMLGNFVKDRNGDIVVVGKVHRDSVADKWGGITFDDEIEPIPVTKEILKEIGFEKYEDLPLERNYYRYWDKDRRYKLEVCDDEGWCNSDRKLTLFVDNSHCMGIGSAEFTYIHELQNLVRVITGHNLPITKEILEDV